jgi:sulfur relay (sulfurtransferase) DsrC/TusE family protein
LFRRLIYGNYKTYLFYCFAAVVNKLLEQVGADKYEEFKLTEDHHELLFALNKFYNVFRKPLEMLQTSYEPSSMMVLAYYDEVTTQ